MGAAEGAAGPVNYFSLREHLPVLVCERAAASLELVAPGLQGHLARLVGVRVGKRGSA
jgi:hypothetical protein